MYEQNEVEECCEAFLNGDTTAYDIEKCIDDLPTDRKTAEKIMRVLDDIDGVVELYTKLFEDFAEFITQEEYIKYRDRFFRFFNEDVIAMYEFPEKIEEGYFRRRGPSMNELLSMYEDNIVEAYCIAYLNGDLTAYDLGKYIDNMPADRGTAEKIMRALDAYEVFDLYIMLFKDFIEFLTPEEYARYRSKFSDIFDKELVVMYNFPETL